MYIFSKKTYLYVYTKIKKVSRKSRGLNTDFINKLKGQRWIKKLEEYSKPD